MYKDRVIALAGVCQSVQLVHHVACGRPINEQAFKALIRSVYCLQAPNTLSVYGRMEDIQMGVHTLLKLLDKEEREANRLLTQYLMSVLFLSKKFSSKPKLTEHVGIAIERYAHQLPHLGEMHPQVISNLAQLYLESLGTLLFRIKIIGEKSNLSRQDVADKIRALLLSGVRSAVLWRQNGGAVYQLAFGKKHLRAAALDLLLPEKHSTLPEDL